MSRMTMVQVGVVLFAVCLLTQVRGSFYLSLKQVFNTFKIFIGENGYYSNSQIKSCAFISRE